jgi:hypothetical protein
MGIFKISENSKTVAKRQMNNERTNTNNRSLKIYGTLTIHRHITRNANCSIAEDKWS